MWSSLGAQNGAISLSEIWSDHHVIIISINAVIAQGGWLSVEHTVAVVSVLELSNAFRDNRPRTHTLTSNFIHCLVRAGLARVTYMSSESRAKYSVKGNSKVTLINIRIPSESIHNPIH